MVKKHILHILKDPNPKEALSAIAQQAGDSTNEVTILLIQEAVRLKPVATARVYVLEEDAKKRGVDSDLKKMSYSEMLDRILASDSVIAW